MTRSPDPGSWPTDRAHGPYLPTLPFVVLCLLSVASAVLQVASDALQGRSGDHLSFPLVPTLFTAQLLNALVLVGFALLARRVVPHFRLYQPFVGGQSFVVMQAFAYLCGVVSLLIAFGYVRTLQTHNRHGVLSFAGMLSLAAHVLSGTSISFFDASKVSTVATTRRLFGLVALHTSPNRETVIVVGLQVALVTLCCAAYAVPEAAGGYCVLGAVAAHIASGGLIHVVIGWVYTPHYRLFMPMAAGLPGLAIQAVAWILFVAALYVGLFTASTIGNSQFIRSAAAATLVTFVAMSVLCNTLLLLFVRLIFASRVARRNKGLTNQHHHRHHHRDLPDDRTVERSVTSFASHGAITITAASVMHALVIGSLFLIQLHAGGGTASFPASSISAYLEGWLEDTLRDFVLEGAFVIESLCAIFLLALPPCTHLVGRVAFGEVYELWQPFKGPLDFVLLQSAGWTCFGTAIFFLILHLSHVGELGVIVSACAALLSQIFIHASLTAFNNRPTKDPAAEERPTLTRPAAKSALIGGLQLTGVNGEMLTGAALALLAFILRLLCKASSRDGGDDRMYVLVLLLVSTGFFMASVPLAHVSVRHKGMAAFSPFAGPGEFIALQAVGWTLYSILVLCNMYATGEQFRSLVDYSSHKAGSDHTLPVVAQVRWLSSTVQAVVNLLPFAVISLSVFVCEDDRPEGKVSQGTTSEEVTAAVARLKVLITASSSASSSPRSMNLAEAEELKRLVSIIEKYHLAGRLVAPRDASVRDHQMKGSSLSRDPRHHAATVVVTLMSLASGTAFVAAGVLAQQQEERLVSLVVGIGGFVVTVASCVGTHAIYGPFIHNNNNTGGTSRPADHRIGKEGRCQVELSSYKFFMPFEGGLKFVLLQAVGWGCLAACLVLLLLVVIAGATISAKPSLLVLVCAGALSVAAQYVLVGSIAHFVPPSPSDRMKLLDKNVEGAVAFLLFLASFLFSHIYTSLGASGDRRSHGLGEMEVEETPITNYIVPVVVTTIATAFALPLSAIAIRRSALKHAADYRSQSPDADSLVLDAQQRSGGGGLSARAADVAASIALLALSFLPVVIIYAAFYAAHHYTPGVAIASYSWQLLLLVLAITMAMTLLPSIPGVPAPPRWVISLRCSFLTFGMYSLPTIVVVGSYSLPFLFPTSVGATTFVVVITTLTVGASAAATRKICFAANFCVIGYASYKHVHQLITVLGHGDHDVLAKYSWPAFSEVFADTVCLLFWIPYARRYHRKPHETGALRSQWFLDHARKYLFADVERYFSFRVIRAADKHTPAFAKGGGDDRQVRKSQGCLYSFHPHGIFPGTALFCTLTNAWAESRGQSSEPPITIHAASVIFNVPLLRDFLLAVGGRVVTKKAIESSLQEGNSVLIVTGGQSEMMLSASSTSEMHLVTHHLGFVKIATAQGVPLVPLLCFAEQNVMNNISLPWLQKRTLKLLGFPFPTVPFGRWYLPLPNRTPLTVVVGAPIYPEPGLSPEDAEGIERLAKRYFESVKQLFYEHRAAAGYPNMELYLHHGLSRSNPKTTLKRAQSPPAAEPPTASAKQHQTNVSPTKAALSRKR